MAQKEGKKGDTVHRHPGEFLRTLYLDRLGLSVGQAAAAVGISRKYFSQLLNGHFSISPEVAIRLSRAFGTAPQTWLMLQMEYDLEQAEEKLRDVKVEKLL